VSGERRKCTPITTPSSPTLWEIDGSRLHHWLPRPSWVPNFRRAEFKASTLCLMREGYVAASRARQPPAKLLSHRYSAPQEGRSGKPLRAETPQAMMDPHGPQSTTDDRRRSRSR
jgi:hypothetical protein